MKYRTREIRNKHYRLTLTNKLFKPTWRKFPRNIQLNTHNRCNLNCGYCNVKEGGSFKTKREVMHKSVFYETINVIEPYSPLIEGISLFMNGEPLMEKRLDVFHDYLLDYPYYGIIDSNGTYPEKADMLLHPFIQTIRISLSAHNRELYLEIHGVDVFDQVLETLNYLKKRVSPSQRLSINHMVCKENFKYVDSFLRAFKDYNVILFPLHKGYMQNNSFLHDTDYLNQNISIDVGGKTWKNWIKIKGWKKCQCWDLLGIGLHGELMHCVDYPELCNYGNIFDTDIREAWLERIKNKRYALCATCSLYLPNRPDVK